MIDLAKTKKKMGHVRKIILALCIVVFLCSSALVIRYYMDVKGSEQEMESLANLIEEPKTTDSDEDSTAAPDYSALLEINPGFVGWVSVPNTSVNYPVVKTVDNNFYLNHNFNKEYDSRGAVFMDYRNNPVDLDANTIIYSHNYYDTTMFSELTQYENIDFYKKTPVFEFNTVERKYKWKIYAVFITNASADEDNGYIFNYIYPYMDDYNFDGFIAEVNKRRLYVTDVDINDDDKMLILSTCIRTLDLYNKYGKRTYRANTRIAILARAVRDGESEEVNVEKAYVNPNPKYPQLYYDKHGITNPYKDDEKWYPQEVLSGG